METVIRTAAKYGHIGIICNHLIDHNGWVGAAGAHDELIVTIAAEYGRLDAIKLVFETRPEIEFSDETGILRVACSGGRADVVKFLVSAGLRFNTEVAIDSDYSDGPDDQTIEHLCITGNCEILSALITAGADPGIVLLSAISHQQMPVINLAIARGANVNAPSALCAIFCSENSELLELVDPRAGFNYACEINNLDLAKYFAPRCGDLSG